MAGARSERLCRASGTDVRGLAQPCLPSWPSCPSWYNPPAFYAGLYQRPDAASFHLNVGGGLTELLTRDRLYH